MSWLTWRQGRAQLIGGSAVLAVLGLFLLFSKHQMTGYMNGIGLTACLREHRGCDSLSRLFSNRYGSLLGDISYLNLAPLLVGMFWGAPLLAREYEQGTEVLAWSQTVSRRRWFTYKLVTFGGAAILGATAFALMLSWWFGPFASIATHGGESRIQPNVFDVQGLVPIGYALFALALGTAAGAFIRRTVPTIAVTIGGFLAARLLVQSARGHLLTPVRSLSPLVGSNGDVSLGPSSGGSQGWVLDSSVVDRSGHPVPDGSVLHACSSSDPSVVARCIEAHGYRQLEVFQPLSRYWALQGLELAIFVVLAFTLIAVAVYAITRQKPLARLGWSRVREPSSAARAG